MLRKYLMLLILRINESRSSSAQNLTTENNLGIYNSRRSILHRLHRPLQHILQIRSLRYLLGEQVPSCCSFCDTSIIRGGRKTDVEFFVGNFRSQTVRMYQKKRFPWRVPAYFCQLSIPSRQISSNIPLLFNTMVRTGIL